MFAAARLLPVGRCGRKDVVANFGDRAKQGKTPTELKTHLRLSAVGGFYWGLAERAIYLEPPKVTPKTRLKTRLKTSL